MTVPFWLMLPPPCWREQIPRLVQVGGFGVAHLARNFHADARELIARDLRPVAPPTQGDQFGPLDDRLLVRLQPRVLADDLQQLFAGLTPRPKQLVAGLILGRGPAAGQWLGQVWDEACFQPLAGFTLVGPGMRRVSADRPAVFGPNGAAGVRWSRTRGALGEAAWRQLRSSRVAVVGAGRNGSAAALTLALLGVGKLVLIDPDADELHNLDATLAAAPAGMGRPKVRNRQEGLRAIRPDDLEIEVVAEGLPQPRAVEALRGVDLLVTCVDRDAPRLAAALVANRWCKVHLDIGTGVFEGGNGRQLGGDVRLLLPGEACVVCLGGLRNLPEACYEVAAPPGALRRGQGRPWHQERAGSLVTINQVAVNLGLQTWLDMLAGAIAESRWCRLEWGRDATPVVEVTKGPSAVCDLCRGASAGRDWQTA